MCVTSPPYWGSVRVYKEEASPWGVPLGGEQQPSEYVAHLVEVFREVRRVLRCDGCCWLNLGDVFAASGKGGGGIRGERGGAVAWGIVAKRQGFRGPPDGYKMKDLTLVAFAVADALRRDGWYLRQTVIWQKPYAVEPLRLDRPATAHEYVFQLTRERHYATRDPGEPWWGSTVWTIQPHVSRDHPATMPEELARRCIVASSIPGDIVLDPFSGSGTSGRVALRHGRRYVGLDISREYLVEQSRTRIDRIQHEMGLGL
jgi:site-specific DNA-methyltransferase (adenine-specific)